MVINVWVLAGLVLVAYLIAKKAIGKFVKRIGRERNIHAGRIHYVLTILNFSLAAAAVLVIGGITGVGYKQFGFFLSSFIAILGVALFAQWSILTNITASILVFFFFPYRVGDYVKILDGDNSVEGRIKEIALFHVILKYDDDKTITFPNALVFQKAVVIDSSSRTPASVIVSADSKDSFPSEK